MSRAPLDLDEDAVRKTRMIERFTGILEASRAAAPAVVAATVADIDALAAAALPTGSPDAAPD